MSVCKETFLMRPPAREKSNYLSIPINLFGHADVRTTMIYTHVLIPNMKPVKSPLDLMGDKS